MCRHCDYQALLGASGLETTEKRLRVFQLVGNSPSPLPAGAIFDRLKDSLPINRVTVYRILDLLVEHRLVDRLSTGGRAFYYGLAPNSLHPPHPHFYCKQCGRMDCLESAGLTLGDDLPGEVFPGRIEKVEVRVDGICTGCLR
jgi:Fur family ferric uptake transcriptional regulator